MVNKRPSHRRVGVEYQPLDYVPRCPKCQRPMLGVGDAFRAPAKDDVRAWKNVERDLKRGRTFVRDEVLGPPQGHRKRQNASKGVHSLFQLPARKRRRKSESAITATES